MAGNKIRFGFDVDDGGALKKINGFNKAFDKLGGKGSSASLFGNVAAKGVALGFNLIADAASGAVGFIQDATQAAIEDQASIKRLSQTLMNNIPAWDGNTEALDKYIDAQADFGFSDDEVRDSIGQTIGITHDLTKSMELNSLAQDLARSKNIDLATATDIVTKAAQGNSKALKTLGIDVGKTTDATVILNRIQQNVKGSAEAWAGTMEGRLKTAQIKWNETVEKAGYTLLPVLTDALDALVKFAPTFTAVLGTIGDAMRGIGDAAEFATAQINKLLGREREFRNMGNFRDLQQQSQGGGGGGKPMKKLADGGVVRSPTVALIGESGPEAVVPLTGGRGGGFVIQGISEREIVDMVDRGLYFRLRRAAPTQGRA